MTEPDGELLNRARAGESQALAEIYDRYAERIYRYLARLVGDAAQAEDLTGETFLRLLKALRAGRPPQQLDGWLYRVAHNLAMDWYRRQRDVKDQPWAEGTAAADDSPAHLLEQQETRQRLRHALRRLTADQQRVVVLRFGEGLRLAEVARLMGRSEGAIKILQHRALQRLRALMS